MDGFAPRFLIRDRDEQVGAIFDRVAAGVGTRVIKTAVRAPNMNPGGERFVGSLWREALDHMLLSGEDHLRNIAAGYMAFSTGPGRIRESVNASPPDLRTATTTAKSSRLRYSAASIMTIAGSRNIMPSARTHAVASTGPSHGTLTPSDSHADRRGRAFRT